MRKHQSGNVLFLILIAVALFAALAYAVTNSSRPSTGNVSSDKFDLAASNIMNYGAAIKSAILRMQVSNDCTDDQISFETPLHWYNYTNSNAPSSKKCNVFDPAGGGIAFIQVDKFFPELWKSGAIGNSSTEHFMGNSPVPQIGTDCGTAGCSDLILIFFVTRPAAKKLCDAYNKKLGIAVSPTSATGPGGWPPFTGTYTNPYPAPDSVFNGQYTMCYLDNSTTPPTATIYYVLIAR